VLGSILIIDSLNDFYRYNFSNLLFVFMRSNSSIIAEFIFGTLLSLSGFQILKNNKSWLNLIKTLTVGVIINITAANNV
jgi:hypothetical protein